MYKNVHKNVLCVPPHMWSMAYLVLVIPYMWEEPTICPLREWEHLGNIVPT